MDDDHDRLMISLINNIEQMQYSNETIVLMPEAGPGGMALVPSGPIREGFALVWTEGFEGYAKEMPMADVIDLVGIRWVAMRESDFARLLKIELGTSAIMSRHRFVIDSGCNRAGCMVLLVHYKRHRVPAARSRYAGAVGGKLLCRTAVERLAICQRWCKVTGDENDPRGQLETQVTNDDAHSAELRGFWAGGVFGTNDIVCLSCIGR